MVVQHRAQARFELEPNLPLVMADQTQLQQVILNLVQNGCEVIQDTPESRRAVTVRTKQRGDRELEISVNDNGCGISESLGERVFEPFFTTRRKVSAWAWPSAARLSKRTAGACGRRRIEAREQPFTSRYQL